VKTTITEALAEIKTLNARIKKKREVVMVYLARDALLRDPHEKDGGSLEFIKRERQAIADLEENIVRIREAIQQSNLESKLSINGDERSIAGWLNWRREVSDGQKKFLASLTQKITGIRQDSMRQGYQVVDKESDKRGEVIIAINEQRLAEETESLEQTLGTLDGKLSLLNATTTINV
jgi:hypothetical protein